MQGSGSKQCQITQYHADDAYYDTNLDHILLLDKVGGVCKCVRGCGDGQDHCAAGCDGYAYQYGRCAAYSTQFITHSRAHNHKDRHEQGCGSRVGYQVGESVAQQAGEDYNEQGREVAERYGTDDQCSQTGSVHGITQCKSTCNHPDYGPVYLFKVILADNTCQCEDCKRDERNGICVYAGQGIHHPQQDSDNHGYDDNRRLCVFLHSAFNLQLNGLL